jgi:fructuronate reductase
MSGSLDQVEALSPSLLPRLPASVRRPGYDRAALEVGMAHLGVGAFHRCHQAEFTDDLLSEQVDRWGVVGINIREPVLADTLGQQDGLYTRLLRQDDRIDARVIGCMIRTVDSQASPAPALEVLASADIDVVTMTVTEKGYCHKPAISELDLTLPDVLHDLGEPTEPRTVPGLLARALELRMQSHGRPLTMISCDNIPSNGAILKQVVGVMAEERSDSLVSWIATNAAFPSTMVDRIVPATAPADRQAVEDACGYRDLAPVVGEPFRQWVIEERFAGRVPQWDRVGAILVDDVAPFELLKMRVLNAAQSAFSYLGLLAGYEHTCDDAADPLLVEVVRRMLIEESVPTVPPVPGMPADSYVEQTFGRLRNTAIRHRNHQIATDGSQKIVQRILNPIRERLGRGESVEWLSMAAASWMVYLILASKRFGGRWTVEDPFSAAVADIADRVGRNSPVLAAGILANEAFFDRRLAENVDFRAMIAGHLDGLLSDDPIAYVRQRLGGGSP